jgi:hypothetical protein
MYIEQSARTSTAIVRSHGLSIPLTIDGFCDTFESLGVFFDHRGSFALNVKGDFCRESKLFLEYGIG